MTLGICECGCGGQTSIAKETDRSNGTVKGRPLRYLRGHNRRIPGAPACGYVVDPMTGCWVWQRERNHQGYGRAKRNGRKTQAHIALWVDRHGPVPTGLELDHLCRNPPCVNPDHLEPVTPTENKRRSLRTKLTREQVAMIKASGDSNRALGVLYGVHAVHVARIRRGVNWGDVDAA